jgi:sugar phosphate isomerase/epimerase
VTRRRLPAPELTFEQRLGVCARTFRRETPRQVAEAIADAGYKMAHWDFAAIGLETVPTDLTAELCDEVRQAFDAVGVSIPSVSATFNIIHPDFNASIMTYLGGLKLITLARRLGASVVTICSGTRDLDDMWRAHPQNSEHHVQWMALRTIEELVKDAKKAKVTIGIEPHPGNTISDAALARRFFFSTKPTTAAGLVLNPANLLTPETIDEQHMVLDHALGMLAPWIVAVHAKDVVASGYSAPGAGLMDYPRLLEQLTRIAPVPLIVQDVTEDDAVRARLDMLRWKAEAHRRTRPRPAHRDPT